jgi:AraC-like DNA-binding protein
MLAADQRLAEYFRTVAEHYEVDMGIGDSLTAQVERLFIQRMAFGETDLKDLASTLSLSERSQQRQLAAEGTSYRAVTESARLSVAKQELRSSGRSLQEVAILLGYSDVRAFRRAFQRLTGLTPSAYRAGQEPSQLLERNAPEALVPTDS